MRPNYLFLILCGVVFAGIAAFASGGSDVVQAILGTAVGLCLGLAIVRFVLLPIFDRFL